MGRECAVWLYGKSGLHLFLNEMTCLSCVRYTWQDIKLLEEANLPLLSFLIEHGFDVTVEERMV